MITPVPSVPSARTATRADVDAITATMTSAFFDDPLWGPAFGDVELRAGQANAFWRYFVASSLRYPWTLVTDKVESATVWIPPGGSELTDAEHAGFEEFLIGITSPRTAAGIIAIADTFEAALPPEPCFYLSLFATHSDHRGAGLGMGLLRESLSWIDDLGAPAYLESSNPVNDARYRSVGFTDHAKLTMPSGHVVTTMWRPAADFPGPRVPVGSGDPGAPG